MAKIDFNDDFRALMIKSYWGDPAGLVSSSNDGVTIRLYDGTPPTQAEIETTLAGLADSWFNSSEGWLQPRGLKDQFELNHNMLVEVVYPSLTQRRQTTKTSVDFFFSQRSETGPGLFEAPATWFWMFQHPDSNNNTSTSFWHVAGTVGLVDSGADMEMLDNNIELNRFYKMNDIKINFNLEPVVPV